MSTETMKKLAVLFPGIGYHCDKPLLYYSARLARGAGYTEQIRIEYEYHGGNLRKNPELKEEALEVLFRQAEEALSRVDFRSYDEVLFLSKSIGTVIACRYAETYGLKCKQVLYTPLEETFRFPTENAVAFTGTADPWVERDRIPELCQQAGVPVTVLPQADHSLEVWDANGTPDILRSLQYLMQVMEATERFL